MNRKVNGRKMIRCEIGGNKDLRNFIDEFLGQGWTNLCSMTQECSGTHGLRDDLREMTGQSTWHKINRN